MKKIPKRCWGPESDQHAKGCRPGRPLCRWKRKIRATRRVCNCPAYFFPHRSGGGVCANTNEKMYAAQAAWEQEMREKVVYICEICEAQHNTSAAALRCENKGRPEAPRFLSARIGGEVAAFGENGVSVAKLSGFFIERESHALLALGNHWGVCCDLDEYNGVPLEVFEPMSSGYFLRYVEPGGEMERAMVAWLNWCRQYDIEPDVTKATWFQDRATKQTSILNALTKVMEGEGQ